MHVLITGANRGIGASLVTQYREQGARVTAAARQGGDMTLDVTRAEDFAALSAGLAGDPVDLLICNAGVYADKGEALDSGYPAQMWQNAFATNVTGVFLTVQSLLPNLRASKAGKVAIIASQMGSSTQAKGTSIIYRVSKAAALNLGFNLASALRPDGIAVGTYHPGWVRTDMGGSGADISVTESAEGLVQRFAALGLENSGCFETWDGRDHAI